MDEAEEWINELEEKAMELIQTEQQNKKRILESRDILKDSRDNMKQSSIHIINSHCVSEREMGQQNNVKIVWKIVAENFSNMGKEIDMQFQEAQSVPNKMKPKRHTGRHIIIKMGQVKE